MQEVQYCTREEEEGRRAGQGRGEEGRAGQGRARERRAGQGRAGWGATKWRRALLVILLY